MNGNWAFPSWGVQHESCFWQRTFPLNPEGCSSTMHFALETGVHPLWSFRGAGRLLFENVLIITTMTLLACTLFSVAHILECIFLTRERLQCHLTSYNAFWYLHSSCQALNAGRFSTDSPQSKPERQWTDGVVLCVNVASTKPGDPHGGRTERTSTCYPLTSAHVLYVFTYAHTYTSDKIKRSGKTF